MSRKFPGMEPDSVDETLQMRPMTNDGRQVKTVRERMPQECFDEACKFNVFGYVAVIIEEDSHLFFSSNARRDPVIWIADTRMFMGETVADAAARTVRERFSFECDKARFIETGRYVSGVFGANSQTKQPIHKLILINALLITSKERKALKISGKYDGYHWLLAGEPLHSKSSKYAPLLRQILAKYVDWIRKEGKRPYHEMLEKIRAQNEKDLKDEKNSSSI